MMRTQVMSLIHNEDIRKNIVFAMASSFLPMVVGMVSLPILTSLLPRQDYGALNYVHSIQSLILAFSAPGVLNAISISVVNGYEGAFRIGTYYRFRVISRNTLFMLPFAGWYLWREHSPSLALLILLGALFLPFSYAFDTGEQLLTGRSNFSLIFWRRSAFTVLLSVSSIVTAWFLARATWVLITRSLVSAGASIIIFLLLLRSIQNNILSPDFWRKAHDLNMLSILGTIGKLIDQLVLGKFRGLNTLAGYSLALSLSSPLDSLSKSFLKVAFGRIPRPRDISWRRRWVLLSSLPVILGIPFLLIAWKLISRLVTFLFPNYPEISGFLLFLLTTFLFSLGANIGHIYSLFQSYMHWKTYYWVRYTSMIILTTIFVFVDGVSGALYVRLGYSIADFLFFNLLLWGIKPERLLRSA